MSFYPLSHAFFRDAIEEIYNKDASISIHLKIYIFTSVCGLQSIEWGDSGIFRCDIVVWYVHMVLWRCNITGWGRLPEGVAP
jgi:hypothetical protein